MKFGLVFMMVVEVISQKSPKIRLRKFFYHVFKLSKKIVKKKKIILAMQNHDEVYIAYYQIPQLFY